MTIANVSHANLETQFRLSHIRRWAASTLLFRAKAQTNAAPKKMDGGRVKYNFSTGDQIHLVYLQWGKT